MTLILISSPYSSCGRNIILFRSSPWGLTQYQATGGLWSAIATICGHWSLLHPPCLDGVSSGRLSQASQPVSLSSLFLVTAPHPAGKFCKTCFLPGSAQSQGKRNVCPCVPQAHREWLSPLPLQRAIWGSGWGRGQGIGFLPPLDRLTLTCSLFCLFCLPFISHPLLLLSSKFYVVREAYVCWKNKNKTDSAQSHMFLNHFCFCKYNLKNLILLF